MPNPFEDVEPTDSFVLGFERHGDEIWIRVLFCLAAGHACYAAPPPEDHACYRHGWLKLKNIRTPQFTWKGVRPISDPTGEVDYGTFDELNFREGMFVCCGDWGAISVECTDVEIALD